MRGAFAVRPTLCQLRSDAGAMLIASMYEGRLLPKNGGTAYGDTAYSFSYDGIRLRRKTLSVLIPDNRETLSTI